MQSCFQERVIYFWRHQLYGHARILCEKGIQEKSNNLILFLWHGLSLAKLGLLKESLEEIEHLKVRKDLILVYKTSLYFIELVKDPEGNEKIDKLRQEIFENVSDKNNFSTAHSAQIAWLFGDIKLARQIIRTISPTPFSRAISAWITYSEGKIQEAYNDFCEQLNDPLRAYDVIPLYGKATCLAALGKNAEAFQVQSQILSKYNFPEIACERSRIHQILNNWDLSLNILSEVQDQLISKFEYYYLEALTLILAKEDYVAAETATQNLIEVCTQIEAKNWKLLQQVALSLATLHSQKFSFIDKIIQIAKLSADDPYADSMSLAILGYCQYLSRNYVISIPSLQKAIDKSPMNQFAADCLVAVMIEIGRFGEAQDQLDMIRIAGQLTLEEVVLQTKLIRVTQHITENIETLLDLLEKRIDSNEISPVLFGDEHSIICDIEKPLQKLTSLRLDTISEALDELIFNNNSLANTISDENVARLMNIFIKLDKPAPVFQPIRIIRGLLLMKVGKVDEALSVFQKILLGTWVYRLPFCMLYIAALLYENEEFEEAKGYLYEAIAADPTLSNSLDYLLTNLKLNGSKENPYNELKEASVFFDKETRSVTQYMDFFKICFDFGEYTIPAAMIKKANECSQTKYEKAMLIGAQAIIFGSKGAFQRAEQLISKLKPHKRYADLGYNSEAFINLKFHNDRKAYIQTFTDLNTAFPSRKHQEVLGDAYNKINDYDKAAKAYTTAFDTKMPDVGILKKLVTVLVNAHKFDEAASILTQSASFLRGNIAVPLYLIKILITLKRYQEAQSCINSTVKLVVQNQVATNARVLEQRGIVCMKLGQSEEAETCFKQALEKYESILLTEGTNKYAISLKMSASNVCVMLGENIEKINRDRALSFYQKALQIDDSNHNAVAHLFALYKVRFDQVRCLAVCYEFLEKYPKNETVVLLMSSAESRDYARAIKYIEGMIEDKPRYYRTFVRLVEVCARAGVLNIAKARIDKYNDDNSAGMSFVRGLYYMYISQASEAVKYFERAMQSNHWCLAAQLMLFSIYSNPDKKFLWLEAAPLAEEASLENASKILAKMNVSETEKQLMHAQLLASTNIDLNVKSALQICQDVLTKERMNLAALTACARYNMRLGDVEEAEKYISSVLAGVPFHETAQYFEEAYLMRATLAKNSPNPRSAHQFIFLALDLNKSCQKAWEMSGNVYFSNRMYQDAVTALSRVWELSGQTDIEAGYNLAFSAMKTSKPELALEISRKILDINPVYRDVKTAIIQPAYRLLYK